MSSSTYTQFQSPPHGFADDARGRFLRRRPPPEAIAWVEANLGGTVRRCRARKGGCTSAIHELWVEMPGDGPHPAILRRYVLAEVIDDEPDVVTREATALCVLDHVNLSTPEVLAIDEDGSAAGVPAVLMSRLPGRVDWTPTDLDRWLRGLAEVLPPLHDTPTPERWGIPDFQPYEPASWEPQPWLANPALWERAVEVFHEPPLDSERVLIHRDYHPGNVLWRRRQVSGIVDWQAMSIGPSSVDAVHCKGNIAGRFDTEIADRFVAIWQEVSGRSYHPWSEVVLLVDGIGGGGYLKNSLERAEAERDLARALAELGR